MEVVFSLIKENPDIEGLTFFSHTFLYSAYADDTTFFLRNKKSATEVIKTFDKFSLFSGLKINYGKCEIAGIGIKKGVKMALCGMNYIDLTEDVIKILGTYFSYNKKLELEKNFLNHIAKTQNILKLWKLRNLTIKGRIVVFKSLAISKLIHLALVTEIPATTINLLTKIQMEFIWKGKNPKIKNSTLCNDYEYGGLINVDVFSKVVSLQCSWIKRLFDNNFHQWKIIPLYLFRQYLGKNFKFHSNVQVSHSILRKFPKFYKETFIRWCKHLASPATLPSTVACQFIWYNKHTQIDNKSIYLHNFSNRNLNFVGQLFDTDGKLKPWESVKQQFFLKSNMQFQYRQIIHALPQHWKEIIKQFAGNLNNLYIQDHHLIKCNTIYNLEKLNSKELYHMQLLLKYDKATCQIYHEKNFDDYDFNWKLIYRIPHFATLEAKIRIFQYKLLNNVLYLNKKLFQFGIISQSKCSFCDLYDETLHHIFYECTYEQNLWNQLRLYISEKVALPVLNPQSAIFGFTDVLDQNYLLVNHLLLIFKYNIIQGLKILSASKA